MAVGVHHTLNVVRIRLEVYLDVYVFARTGPVLCLYGSRVFCAKSL